jgi:hypothetical protein
MRIVAPLTNLVRLNFFRSFHSHLEMLLFITQSNDVMILLIHIYICNAV